MVKAYRAYIKGWTQVQDGQDVVVIRRTTEAGIDVGFVHFMDGKLTGLPGNDLMKNCMLPEVRSQAQTMHFCMLVFNRFMSFVMHL